MALLIVTHRLASACPFSNSIVVLELGRVSAIGTHEHLLACHPGGVYDQLWSGQMGDGAPGTDGTPASSH